MRDARRYLDLAAKLALRGHGGAEPNPMVGCVIVNDAGQIVSWGYHRAVGGPHAERVALNRAGQQARGCTMYVTLEPCNNVGRTGPCTEAIIAAGIKRVVFAQRDPHAKAQGSEARLRAAGVDVVNDASSRTARLVSAPFVHRVTTGLPFVVAKWAQTLDGRVATRTGESKWISSERSRRLVHRERGRVDAILTGTGTVFRDDPMLTVRHGRKRRTPRRIVLDRRLEISMDSKLLASAREAPLTLVCTEATAAAMPDRVAALRERGADVFPHQAESNKLELRSMLQALAAEYDITTMLVEAGPRLLAPLVREGLINLLWVFIAPMVFADNEAVPALRDLNIAQIADAPRFTLLDARRRGDDMMLLYGTVDESP